MKQLKHWQDGVNVLLGAWMVLSPWALGFQGDVLVTSNAVLVGLALVATALGVFIIPGNYTFVEALGRRRKAGPAAPTAEAQAQGAHE